MRHHIIIYQKSIFYFLFFIFGGRFWDFRAKMHFPDFRMFKSGNAFKSGNLGLYIHTKPNLEPEKIIFLGNKFSKSDDL